MIAQHEPFCNEEISADEAAQMSEEEWLAWLNSGLDEQYDEIPFALPLPSHYFESYSCREDYGLEAIG